MNKCARAASAVLSLMCVGWVAAPAAAQWSPSRADSHAPIGVMGDHRHEKGEVMLSYRYMYMAMEGSRDGTAALTDAEIVSPTGNNFIVTPTKMPMSMFMFGAMFAPSDQVTLMAMLPILDISMDHMTRAGGMFTTESGGLGDVKVGAMVGLTEWEDQSLHLNAMLSLPTGSIEAMDELPSSNGNEVQLPYPMQVGSGTFDLMPAVTWLGQLGDWSWGAQGGGTFRLGSNDRDWTLGDRVMATAWWSRNLNRNFAASLRLQATDVGEIDGMDAAPSVNPAVVPTARTDLRGGSTVELGLGLNVYIPQMRAFRLAWEGMLPLYRDLNGPQLETDWRVTVGLQVVPIR